MKRAAEKKLEDERVIERKVQRERELEGDQFKDKEQFMTAGYKKKLEELKRKEEEEKRKLAGNLPCCTCSPSVSIVPCR